VAGPTGVDEDEPSLAVNFTVLADCKADILPGIEELALTLSHGCHSDPGAGGRAIGPPGLDLGVCPIRRGEVATRPCRADRAHKVEIGGHWLLSEPHGFEGFVPTSIHIEAGCSALADRPYMHHRERRLDAAMPGLSP